MRGNNEKQQYFGGAFHGMMTDDYHKEFKNKFND